MSVELVPASSLSHAELADLFTASFQGYVVPMEIDEAAFRHMAALYDFDLDASRVAARDGRPIGLANLGVREDAGWIGGMGVVADERRNGIGQLLMRSVHGAARRLGLREVGLEVIDSNAPAIALYEKLTYEHVRELETWTLDAEAPATAAREVLPAEAHAQMIELRRAPEPWQRADASLERMLAAGVEAHGLLVSGGAAVVRLTPNGAVVEQIAAADVAAARDLLARSLAAGRPVRLTNVPAGDPVGEAFAALGGRLDLRQHELRLELRDPRRGPGRAP